MASGPHWFSINCFKSMRAVLAVTSLFIVLHFRLCANPVFFKESFVKIVLFKIVCVQYIGINFKQVSTIYLLPYTSVIISLTMYFKLALFLPRMHSKAVRLSSSSCSINK